MLYFHFSDLGRNSKIKINAMKHWEVKREMAKHVCKWLKCL